MMGRWREATLGELLRIKHGFAFKGEFFANSGSTILLTPGNFKPEGGLRLKGDKEKYYSGMIPRDFVLDQGDMLIAMTDLTQTAPILGSAAIVPESSRFLHNQRLGKVIDLNTAETTQRFVYYLFNSEAVRAQIRATATGATVKHTAPDRIYDVRVVLPPRTEQLRIASILSAYDDLIENCERRICVLDEMARALYREWFVVFRYPGHVKVKLVDTAVGKVPEGWKAGVFEDIASLQRGFDITKAQQREGPYPVISSSGPGSTHDEYKMTGPGVVIGRKGTLGTVFFSEGSYWPHDTTLWVTDFHGHGPWFCFQLLGKLKLEQYDCGASNPTINRNHIHKIPVIVPPSTLTVEYDRTIGSHMRLAQVLRERSMILRRTRDLLLPRLLSGQLSLEAPA